MFGKLLALPFRIVNAPIRIAETAVDLTLKGESTVEDRVLSVPLDALADAIEEVLDGR